MVDFSTIRFFSADFHKRPHPQILHQIVQWKPRWYVAIDRHSWRSSNTLFAAKIQHMKSERKDRIVASTKVKISLSMSEGHMWGKKYRRSHSQLQCQVTISFHHVPAALHSIMDPCTLLVGGWETTELVWRSGKPKTRLLLPGLKNRISLYCMHFLIHRRFQLLKFFSLRDR